MSKPRVHLRLDGRLLALLEASAREQDTSKTAVLEEALGPYCWPWRSIIKTSEKSDQRSLTAPFYVSRNSYATMCFI